MEELLIEKIVRFCCLLREQGVNVTYSDAVDAIRAVSEVGVGREAFYHALKCTLVKDYPNMKLFYALFQLFFNPPESSDKAEADRGDSLDELTGKESLQDRPRRIENAQRVGMKMQKEMEDRFKGPLYVLLAKAVKNGDYEMLQFIAHKGVESLGEIDPQRDNVKELLQRARENIGWGMAVSMVFGPSTF